MNLQRITLVALRVSLGCLYLYAGITKVMDPAWSAAGYIGSAKNFTWFFQWLLNPQILPFINFINEWGLTLLGLSLILGIGVRLSSVLGAVLMMMYYAVLSFPYPNTHSFIVDEHIIYTLVLLFFAAVNAGRMWGLDGKIQNSSLYSNFPKLRNILG